MLNAENATRFEETLGQLLDNIATLKACLLPLLPASISSASSQSSLYSAYGASIQESLVRILLELPKLQTRLLALLIEKLPEFEYRDGDSIEDNMPKLILGQFRWLPWIENSTAIAEAFIGALSLASSSSLKHDIITWIPETADDLASETLVPALVGVMESEPELLGVCLDTLSNLKLYGEHLDTVQKASLELLNSVDPENVPVLLKFLFRVVRTESLPHAFKQIRKHLKLETLPSAATKSAQEASKNPKSMTGNNVATIDCPAMLVECLNACIRARSELATAFLQEFTSFSPKEDRSSARQSAVGVQPPAMTSHHTILDIWILFMIHANVSNLRPKVELVLRKKILSGQIRNGLLNKAVATHPSALRDLCPTLLEISQVLMQHCHQDTTDHIKLASITMYIAIFLTSEPHARQALLAQLMRHVSSTSIKEAGGALETFDRLVTKYPSEMEPFAPLLQGLIDFMDGSRLHNAQLMQVYFIFAKLAYPKGALSCGAGSGSKSADFLTMLILKQISNPETRYRQMGALGSAALICVLGAPVASQSETEIPDENILQASLQRIQEILASAFSMHTPEALELFLDELSSSLTTLAQERPLRPEIVQQICLITANVISDIAQRRADCIEAITSVAGKLPELPESSNEQFPSESLIPSSIWCDVAPMWPKDLPSYEDAQAGALCFDLSMDDSGPSTKQHISPEKMATLAAMIRLLFSAHESAGQFEDIYLVLYSSFKLFPRPGATSQSILHAFYNTQRQKTLELIACQLLHTINILRELVNVAARHYGLESPYIGIPMEDYIALRMAHLVQLEAYLESVLDHIPLFPMFPSGSSAQVPLTHASDILRESASTAKVRGGKKVGLARKPKQPKVSPGSKTNADLGVEDDDTEVSDSESSDDEGDGASETGQTKAENGVDRSTGTDAVSSSTTTASSKAWGNTGSFDVSKYRRNIHSRLSSKIRPLLPHALNALHQIHPLRVDNQILWDLLLDLSEKATALGHRKPSLNPAKYKPDAPWLRPYRHHEACAAEMLPAFRSLPMLLVYVLQKSEDSVSFPENMSHWTIAPPTAIGGFGSQPIGNYLRNPCVRVILQMLKVVFSQSVFDPVSIARVGGGSGDETVAEGVAKAILSDLPRKDEATEALECNSWTEHAQACFARLSSLIDEMNDFESAVGVLEILVALAGSITTDEEAQIVLRSQASLIAGGLLSRYWTEGNAEPSAVNSIFRDKAKNMPLESLERTISYYLGSIEFSEENAQLLAQSLGIHVEKMKKKSSTEAAQDEMAEEERYSTLTNATLGIFFKTALTRAVRSLSEISLTVEEGEEIEESERGRLASLATSLKICAYLLKKAFPTPVDRGVLNVALKQGKLMVEAFQAKADWMCSQVERYPVEVQHAMKTYQTAARSLQALCTSVKEGQHKQLGGLIAPLKKAIETVISRVRLLSDKHGFGDLLDVRVSVASAAGATKAGAGPTDGVGGARRKRKAPTKSEQVEEEIEEETEEAPAAKRRA